MTQTQKHALLSVFNKAGIAEFARALAEAGWTILASGGTAKTIIAAGVPVRDVAELVGGKAILGHRVVTLSREVHAGLLSKDTQEDAAELTALGIPRIDLVCVDMYPLSEAIAEPHATVESVTEMTDIGGPTMLRSGAKGRRIVVCDPADRERVLQLLRNGGLDEEARLLLAAKAEFTVADYVLQSAKFLGDGEYEGFLGSLARELCYGENRRQKNAAFFRNAAANDPLALDKFQLIEGNDPSFVNMTDVHRLLETATRLGAGWQANFGQVPFLGVAVKHGNACGAAVGDGPDEVIRKVVAGDPDAISGGLTLVNFQVDAHMAQLLRSHMMPEGAKRILDSVIAPGFTPEAVEELARKTGKCRLFRNPALAGEGLGTGSLDATRRFRQVRGGFLTQDGDPFVLKLKDEWHEVLTKQQERDLVLGWAIGSTANSNTIVLVKNDMLLGGGTGQRSRVMAARVALLYADAYHRGEVRGAVAYSDSFFPFPDGPLLLAGEGVSVIFATSGSIRDEEVAKVCEDNKVIFLRLPDAEARGFYGH